MFIMIFFSLQQHVDVIISHSGSFDTFDLNTGKQILLSTILASLLAFERRAGGPLLLVTLGFTFSFNDVSSTFF